MNKINWKFIGAREGAKLNGYVPDVANGNSGVTIATGFDIGHATNISMAALPQGLQMQLGKYRHLFGIPALHMLHTNPLLITDDQAAVIDSITQVELATILEAKYQNDAGIVFNDIPEPAQTVIASVTFQYGRPWDKTPSFWGDVVKQDWQAVHQELMNFGDKYPARRKIEAAYLAPIINTQGAMV